MKYALWYGEMLTDARRGTITRWTYYSDGTTEVTEYPGAPIFVPPLPLF